jgi:ATP-binding cassette subfamily B protein
VKHVDQILVLNEGRIVERGTHDALLAAGGLYADMHARQLLEEELEEQP